MSRARELVTHEESWSPTTVKRRAANARGVALRHGDLAALLIVGDLVASVLGAWISPFFWDTPDYDSPPFGLHYWQIAAILSFLSLRLNHASGGDPRRVVGAVGRGALGMLAIILVLFYFAPYFAPRGLAVISIPVITLCVLSWRLLFVRLLDMRVFDRSVAVIGTDDAAKKAARAIVEGRGHPYRLVAFFSSNDAGRAIFGVPVLPVDKNLWGTVRGLGVDQVLLGMTESLDAEVLDELVKCFDHGVEAVPATKIYEELTGRVLAAALGPQWYAELPTHNSGWYAVVKRLVDVACGALMLMLFTPVMVMVGLITVLDSGWPMLLRQIRVGRGGRLFVIHKFRTMRRDAEPSGAPVWAAINDSRVTRAGRLLRRSRLDELPQLWDVVRGSMSLIGPRPERPEFVERLVEELPLFRARTLVRPGITGWAQVQYPYASSMEANLAKLEFDLYYICHLGPGLDARVALSTLGEVFGLRGR